MAEVISEHINVFCRLRPAVDEETEGQAESSVTFHDHGTCVYSSGGKRENLFEFSACFGPQTAQSEVYENVAKPIVDSTIRGYNSTIIAYGPTGSGKTHTMRGNNETELGIMPR